MPDYEKMYYHLLKETNRAINIIFKAQQECQKMYLCLREAEELLPPSGEAEGSGGDTPL